MLIESINYTEAQFYIQYNMRSIFITLLLLISITISSAQIRWYNPQNDGALLHGQALQNEPRSNYYQRLPDRVESEVRGAVWNLSKNSAGESLQF